MPRTLEYEELTLRIKSDARDGDFRVEVIRAPFGGPRESPFYLPFRDLRALLSSLERHVWRSGQRALSLATTQAPADEPGPHEVGGTLFDALFRDAVRETLFVSLARLDGERALRIRLLFDPEDPAFPTLGCLPWELLFRRDTRDFLSQDVRTPLVRQLDVPHATSPPPRISSLRILVVMSSPAGLMPLDVDRELDKIKSAWGRHGGVQLLLPEQPTIQEIRRLLREQPFDVLHFVGHGQFDPATGQGVLCFEDEAGNPHKVSGELLADTLKTYTRVRLVFLNACETARLTRHEGQDPYRGVASALLIGGIPAVVAMQFPISDGAAIAFSDMFYRSLAEGDPVDVAVTEARLAVRHQDERSWEWITPVLFLSVYDARLFDLARPDGAQPEGTAASEPAAALEASAPGAVVDPDELDELFQLQRWDDAKAALETARQADPKNPDVYFRLALARIAGRRPRSLTLAEVGRIETDLRTALRLAGDPAPSHVLCLWALVKYDFYRFNGLRLPPPTVEEILGEASQAERAEPDLRRILALVPTPPNPVREALQEIVDGLN